MRNSPLSAEGLLKPSLLDRLVPETEFTNAGRGSCTTTAQTSYLSGEEGAIVGTVERDLLWLFNTSSALVAEPANRLRRYPYAASSVLNYGLRHVFGRVVQNLGEIEKQVETALARFEPRLVVERKSFKLTREGQLVEIELVGFLRIQGARRNLRIRTDLQTLESKLESGVHG